MFASSSKSQWLCIHTPLVPPICFHVPAWSRPRVGGSVGKPQRSVVPRHVAQGNRRRFVWAARSHEVDHRSGTRRAAQRTGAPQDVRSWSESERHVHSLGTSRPLGSHAPPASRPAVYAGQGWGWRRRGSRRRRDSGIFASFSYFAVLQEDVYKKKYGEQGEKFSATLLAIFVERAINAVLALIGMLVLGGSGATVYTLQPP